MGALGLNSGRTVKVFDYSPNPRTLLARLDAPIREFGSATFFPVVHVRRGWLHGSHAVVTVRRAATGPADIEPALDRLEDAIRTLAADLRGSSPTEADYLATAEELGRWENQPGPYLPLHPHGHVERGIDKPPANWSAELVFVRDLMLAALLEPVVAAAGVVEDDDLLSYAARVLALVAESHPGGTLVGTWSYRSHCEAMLSWNLSSVNPGKAFRARFEADGAEFVATLDNPIGTAPARHVESLQRWRSGIERCWGIATAAALQGQIDASVLNSVGRMQEAPTALTAAERSKFHESMHSWSFDPNGVFWHLAHRMVVNLTYQSLAGLGLTALQRYYLCFGLSEASDRATGKTWAERIASYAEARAASRSWADHLADGAASVAVST